MITRIHLLSAACLATSALLFTAPSWADTIHTEKTVVKTEAANGTLTLPAGITPKDLNADKAIEKSFQGLSNDAMDKTGFDNLVAYLADQDKDRVKKSTTQSLNNLDGNKNKALTDVIANLDGAWKSKYNTSFSVDYQKAYTSDFLMIATGEVSDPTLLVGNWPVTNPGMSVEGKASSTDINKTKTKMFGGDVNLEKGRDVALARIARNHAFPELTVSLIHETASGWHFDIPNNINAQDLYDNLVANLNYVNDHRDLLPADVNGGNRMITHAVVAALYNIDLQKAPMGRTAQDR